MGISIAASSTNLNVTPADSNGNNEIKQLEKQKTELMKEAQSLKDSKMDESEKQEKIRQIQQQIQLIEMEIQRIRSEKAESKENKKEEISKKEDPKETGSDNIIDIYA